MKATLALLLCWWGLSLPAQPGYLGKKVTLTYNVPVNIAVYEFSVFASPAPFKAYKTQDWTGEFLLNVRHQVEADYVVGRMSSAGAGLFTLRTAQSHYDDFYIGYKATGIFGYMKLFKGQKRGAVAPVGPWGRVGGGFYVTKFMTDKIPDSLLVPAPTTRAMAPMVMLSLGNTRVFGNKVVVNVATDLILSAYSSKPVLLSQELLGMISYARVPGHLFLNFSAGMGWLF